MRSVPSHVLEEWASVPPMLLSMLLSGYIYLIAKENAKVTRFRMRGTLAHCSFLIDKIKKQINKQFARIEVLGDRRASGESLMEMEGQVRAASTSRPKKKELLAL